MAMPDVRLESLTYGRYSIGSTITPDPSRNLPVAASRTEYYRIIALTVGSLAAYAIAQDEVTARLSPEYFTVAHEGFVRNVLTGDLGITSPTLLGLCWGGLVGGGPGLVLGMILADFCQGGSGPTLPVRTLYRPLLCFILTIALCSVTLGLTAFTLSQTGSLDLDEGWKETITPDQHFGFLIDMWTHWGTYAGGILGGIALAVWTARRRYKVGGKLEIRWR